MNQHIKPDEIISGQGALGGGKSGSESSAKNTIRSNAVAEVIELICEGKIKGLVNGARSIYLNETPLKNRKGGYNFKGVKWQFHRGLPDDEPFMGNNRIETPVSVEAQVTKDNGPVTRTITNPLVDGVRVVVRVPALYRYDKDSGAMKKTDLHYKIWVRRPSVSVDWIEVVDQLFDDEKTSSVYQKAHYFDLPDGTGDCDIRIERVTSDSDDEKVANELWWEAYYEIIKGRFTFPNSATMRLRMDARKVGSSMPSRAVEIYGLIVRVPTNYDPETRTYTGIWDGSFKNAWTDNPAWIFYDLITNYRYGMGEFVSENHIDKWSLYTVAQHCDELVDTGFRRPNGSKIKEPRYTYNGAITSREEAFTVLKQIAATWRGMVYWSLGQVYATIDKKQDPVNILTPANVIGGEFRYSGTALKATHSVVLVTWNDPDDLYKAATEVVINEEMLAKYGWREKTLQLSGCTSRSMAHRYGRWILDTEQYENETVEYTAGLDNANVRPGDIIAIADPMKSEVRSGGRLAAAATSTYALLDKPFKPVSGTTYTLMMTKPTGKVITRPNGTTYSSLGGEVISVPIVSFADEVLDGSGASLGYGRVNYAAITDDLPQAASMWAITSNNTKRLYRVLNVREEEKSRFRVTALFHDPDKYNRVERNFEMEGVQYTRHEKYIEPATDLHVVEKHYLDANNKLHSNVHVSWKPSTDPLVKDYKVVYIHPERGRITLAHTDTVNVDLEDAAVGNYTFKIYARATNDVLSEALEGSFTVEGSQKIPAPIVSDLELADYPGSTEFEDRACEIRWKNKFARTSDDTAVEYDHDEIWSPLYAFTRVKVYDVATDELLRSFKTTSNRYTYTFRQNKHDNAAATPARGPSRSLRFEVTISDKLDRESDPAILTVNNFAPSVSSFEVTQKATHIDVKIGKPDADDVEGYMVWMSETSGFTPSNANLVYDGNSRHPVIDCKRGKTYYLICAAYDSFGKSLLNYSAQLMTVSGTTVTDDQVPATPTGLTATSVGDTDSQGHVRSVIKFNWDDNTESFFDHYELEIQEEGEDYTSLKKPTSKHSFRGKIGRTYRYRVRACDAIGNKSAWTVWGVSGTTVTAAGDNTGPEKAVITGIVGRSKGNKITVQECVADDYFKTRFWRYATAADALADTNRTLLGSVAGEVFIDNDNLADETEYWYRAAHVDKLKNVGLKSDPVSSLTSQAITATPAAGSITDAMLSTTAPGVVSAPALAVRQRKDADGTLKTQIVASWTAPSSAVPIKSYEVRIYDGTDFDYRTTKNLSVRFDAIVGLNYVVYVQAISAFGVGSGFVNPNNVIPSTISTTLATPAEIILKKKRTRTRVSWAVPTDKDFAYAVLTDYYSGTVLYRGHGSFWVDEGPEYNTYQLRYYDKQGNPTSPATTALNAGGGQGTLPAEVNSGDIVDGAIIESKLGPSSVTTAKIGNSQVTAAKIAANAITRSELQAGVGGAIAISKVGGGTSGSVNAGSGTATKLTVSFVATATSTGTVTINLGSMSWAIKLVADQPVSLSTMETGGGLFNYSRSGGSVSGTHLVAETLY